VGILVDTKKVLNLPASQTHFDADVILHINSVLSTLNQLGVGPADGLQISDDTTTWDDLFTDLRFNFVKSYVYLRVRMLFDPPQTSFLLEAFKEQYKELEWRINVLREQTGWTDPDPETPEETP
jgi:hypothetical protein